MKPLKKCALLACICILSYSSFGWGVLGHRIVGQIAESYLTANARTAVKNILGDETIALASNWADFIKSDTSYRYISSWHYINFDPGMTKDEIKTYLSKDTATDIYTKMNYLVAQLKRKKLPMSEKRMDLKLLIHFVGDVHQPLHVGHGEDQGGNKIKVTWFGTATNLHSLWDEQLINFQQLSYTEYANAINHTTVAQRMAWQKQPISDWILESYHASENLYSESKEPDEKLSYRYNFDHVALLNERLLKAGVRLAGLLNQIFK